MFLNHEQVLYLKMKDFIVELSKEGGIKMLRILLACAGGMSTSLLMNKMKEEAEQRGLMTEMDEIVKAYQRTYDFGQLSFFEA